MGGESLYTAALDQLRGEVGAGDGQAFVLKEAGVCAASRPDFQERLRAFLLQPVQVLPTLVELLGFEGRGVALLGCMVVTLSQVVEDGLVRHTAYHSEAALPARAIGLLEWRADGRSAGVPD